MIRKPWPIIIIAFIFFLIPIVNVLGTYYFIKSEYLFSDYIKSLFFDSVNIFPLFNMIVPSLVAGIAVYNVKKWSYPVFLISMAWITLQMFYKFSAQEIQTSDFLVTIIIPMIINIGYVSYVLLPKVRAPFFDPRLRWWETKPRYVFSTEIEITNGETITEGKMTNISEGGLFAVTSGAIEPNSIVKLKLTILDMPLEINAKVVYRKPDGASHGLQFHDVNANQKRVLKKIVGHLKNIKCPETRPVPKWNEDLVQWFKTLITTGKGLVPEIQAPPRKED
jgi:Tfp pilus assembly protein PilZ